MFFTQSAPKQYSRYVFKTWNSPAHWHVCMLSSDQDSKCGYLDRPIAYVHVIEHNIKNFFTCHHVLCNLQEESLKKSQSTHKHWQVKWFKQWKFLVLERQPNLRTNVYENKDIELSLSCLKYTSESVFDEWECVKESEWSQKAQCWIIYIYKILF